MTEHHPPDDQTSDEKPRKRRRSRVRLDDVKAEWPVSGGLTLAGSGLVGTLVVVLAWWFFHHQSQVEVPDLVGLSRVVAEAQLKDRGLNLRATYDEVSDQPAGTVLRTDPAARTMLDPHGGVSLVLAVLRPLPTPAPGLESPSTLKPAPVVPPPVVVPAPVPPVVVPPPAPVLRQVPDVIGLDRLRAERMLIARDLRVGSIAEEASDHRAHTVLRTNPRAGTAVWPGSAVDLVLAKCAVRMVPNVIRFDRVRAARTLADNGLTVGSITEQESDQRAQTVLWTDPVVGTAVQCGGAVNLVVAKPRAVSGDSTGDGGTSAGVPRVGGGDTRGGVPSEGRHTHPTDSSRHQPR